MKRNPFRVFSSHIYIIHRCIYRYDSKKMTNSLTRKAMRINQNGGTAMFTCNHMYVSLACVCCSLMCLVAFPEPIVTKPCVISALVIVRY